MSVETYIKENVLKVGDKVYVVPEIQEKKLNNAISAIAPDANPEFVLAIVDSTLFGSAKEGILFTGDTMYVRYSLSEKKKIKFENIVSAEHQITKTVKDNGKVEEKNYIYIYLDDESTIELPSFMFAVNYESLTSLINGIIEEAGDEKSYITTNQTLPLASMDDEIKNAYIKLVCNFAYSDDDIIDSKEYAEIISLIVRIDYNSESRLKLRNYMCDKSLIENNDDLLAYIFENVPEGSLNILKQSLIKDMIYIYKINNDITAWRNNDFIKAFQEKLKIEDNQVDLIVTAIKTDEDILLLRKTDKEITKSMKDLAAKAGAVGVPLAAIYFSGSVIGMSAAGITSGLATLGMGGILGFSGMVTGVGVVVLLGIGTYAGIKKITGIGELENNKQREMMLQAIIKNSQKSLDYLIEDVNEISNQLMIELRNGLETKVKIDKLSKILYTMTSGAKATTEKINNAEVESVIANLPNTLDVVRLKELTNEPTKEKLREFVLSCYAEKEVQEKEVVKAQHVLIEGLNLNQLEQLHSVFQAIGYTNIKDAALASAKGAAKNLVNNVFKK